MKMTISKKIAMIGFCCFLGIMLICTMIAKGIYRAGLSQVITQKPYSSSLTHAVTVTGKVRQGQEYGFFAESGLRVVTISVHAGDHVVRGDALFQVDTKDLQDIINEKMIALERQKDEQDEALKRMSDERQEKQTEIELARENYNTVLNEVDNFIALREQELSAARQELFLYNQYLANLEAVETEALKNLQAGSMPSGIISGEPNDSTVSGSDAGVNENLQGNASQNNFVTQPDDTERYNRQQKRNQLEQNVTVCTQALEEAKRQKDMKLQAAERVITDAQSKALGTGYSVSEAIALEIKCQEETISRLQAIMDTDGWIMAENTGQILECRIAVGERTKDTASILYAIDDGECVIEAVFVNHSGDNLSGNSEIEMIAGGKNGQQIREKLSIDYLTQTGEAEIQAQFFLENAELTIGQPVTLNCRTQTESYGTCVPVNSIHADELSSRDYVYVLEEREGILGKEWRVKKVYVTIRDQTDMIAALESPEITGSTRIITSYTGSLADGDVVRLVN